MSQLLERSEALHARVRAFAGAEGEAAESFEALACDLARFQAEHIPGYRRLVEARGATLSSLASIPAVPTDAFRLTRVAVHPPELDAARFISSGTTQAARSVHPLRSTETYRQLSLRFGARALLVPGVSRHVIVALAPRPTQPPSSSLGFMMQAFMETFDGRALTADPQGAAFDPLAAGRWLVDGGGVDVNGLRRAALIASERQEPLVVLATSFALVLLTDALAGSKIKTPPRTVVMQTGGFKGRTRAVEPAKLARRVARALRMDAGNIVSEYGMTELSSQCWEGRLGAALPESPGLYQAPPWLRVDAVDPISLRPLPEGEVGLARFIDLANVDSAVAIVTRDQVRLGPRGLELLGRAPGAPERGCSLALEALTLG